MLRLNSILVLFLVSTSSVPAMFAEDRLGIQVITDGVFIRAQRSAGSYPASDLRLNGQAALLASYRLTPSLFAFYEGRVNHLEGLNHHDPQLRQTTTTGVLQGYLRYSFRLPSGLNLQVGKFGHPFGQFLTRNYADQNPLIGFPLMYTHRTTIRSSRLPSNVYDFLRWQARAQPLPGYSSDSRGDNGWLPLINFSYPTGLMAFGSFSSADYRFALVNSSLAHPLNVGSPGQRLQWVASGGVTAFQRVRIGGSFATGPYLDASVRPQLPAGSRWRDFTQRALGADLQLTLRHLELQSELLFTNFRVPGVSQRLGATGYFVELKHTLTPRLFVAGRWNQLYFDRFRSGFSNGARPRFDNNRYSVELGLGFHLSEKLLAKVSYQLNRTVVALEPRDDMVGVQLVYRFDPRKLLHLP
ncbi:MAG: hypothetical protein L0387_20475 [Acidobacteria bacterium]|nr:hypothetical protein [Acidobacteriota bacterium]